MVDLSRRWLFNMIGMSIAAAQVSDIPVRSGLIDVEVTSKPTILPANWVPGAGSVCRGVWVITVPGAGPEIPEALRFLLNESAPELLEVISAGRCPYGRKLPGDVTWPSVPHEVSHLVAGGNWLSFIAVFYSYVPYLACVHLVCDFACRRGTHQLYVLGWLAALVCMNEGVIKQLISQPRPGTQLQMRDREGYYVGSCVDKCGMPSSHSSLAIGWLTLLVLDGILSVDNPRILAQAPPQPAIEMRGDVEGVRHVVQQNSFSTESPPQRELLKMKGFMLLFFTAPWKHHNYRSRTEFAAYLLFWFTIMGPVPFMRVALHDHTDQQIFVGCVVGFILAVAWWRFVRHFQRKYQHLEGSRVLYGFIVHDYVYITCRDY